jgi:dihydroorotase
MSDPEYDLLIRADRVVCPARRWDGPGAVGVRGDRFVTTGPDVRGTAPVMLDYRAAVLLPGLIDLHAHPAREGSIFGVDPDVEILPHGVTTVLSQGDAGAWNWPHYRETTIARALTRVRLAVNLSARGEATSRGCFTHLEDIDIEACGRAIEEDAGGLIWGIAVNVSP